GLAGEAGGEVGVAGAQHLDRRRAALALVGGAVDDAHAAGRHPRLDAEAVAEPAAGGERGHPPPSTPSAMSSAATSPIGASPAMPGAATSAIARHGPAVGTGSAADPTW